MTLDILHANVYAANRNKPRAVRRATKTGADSIGINEGYSYLPMLRKRPRYRVTVGTAGRDKRRGAKGTPILTRKKHFSYGSGAMQVSDEVKPTKFAPDRWLTYSLFHHKDIGPVAHVNFHANATARKRRRKHPLVREYRESMRSLLKFVRFLKNEGYFVVVTGDLNWPNVKGGPNWTPRNIFARLGLNVWSVGVDYVAYDPRLRVVAKNIIPKRQTGSDHPWLHIRLARK